MVGIVRRRLNIAFVVFFYVFVFFARQYVFSDTSHAAKEFDIFPSGAQ